MSLINEVQKCIGDGSEVSKVKMKRLLYYASIGQRVCKGNGYVLTNEQIHDAWIYSMENRGTGSAFNSFLSRIEKYRFKHD